VTYVYPEAPEGSPGSVEVGPAPYFHRSDCNMCKQQDGLKTGSEVLDAPRPGGNIVEEEHFVALHAPLKSSSAGTLIIEARRHLLDFAEMTPAEYGDFGLLVHRLVPAVKEATGVERVYYLALMERVAHFHLWLVPKKDIGDLRGVDYLAQNPPLTATYDEADAMAQKIHAAVANS
jgi:diadenosine tetraphosphate (Ap4A) HIT family hydrolase